jgi:hypothetical protein
MAATALEKKRHNLHTLKTSQFAYQLPQHDLVLCDPIKCHHVKFKLCNAPSELVGPKTLEHTAQNPAPGGG